MHSAALAACGWLSSRHGESRGSGSWQRFGCTVTPGGIALSQRCLLFFTLPVVCDPPTGWRSKPSSRACSSLRARRSLSSSSHAAGACSTPITYTRLPTPSCCSKRCDGRACWRSRFSPLPTRPSRRSTSTTPCCRSPSRRPTISGKTLLYDLFLPKYEAQFRPWGYALQIVYSLLVFTHIAFRSHALARAIEEAVG